MMKLWITLTWFLILFHLSPLSINDAVRFHCLLSHTFFRKYIVTADRGYESYDLLFHCELKNLNYVFRVKAPSSSKSLLSYYATELPDDLEEFDVTMKRYFTDKATNVMKDQSDVYRYINPSKNTPHFYELLNRDRRHLYFMQFRVVKIKTAENTYEYLITNLPPQLYYGRHQGMLSLEMGH